jgi:hypothetical protein
MQDGTVTLGLRAIKIKVKRESPGTVLPRYRYRLASLENVQGHCYPSNESVRLWKSPDR